MEPPKCFKCLGSPDDIIAFVGRDGQRYESAPYLRAKLYLCPACAKAPAKHERNEQFDCGCAWNEERYVKLNPYVQAGPTLVARPPDPGCPACSGTGKIRDKHHYLQIKKNVGAPDEAERQAHHYETTVKPITYVFPGGGWQVWKEDWKGTTGGKVGRPPTTTPNLETTKIYLVDVVNEVAKEHAWVLHLSERDFWIAFDAVTNILVARAPSASARLLAEWLPMSKTTIYKRRKRGAMLLQQLDRIENQLQHQAAQNDLRWGRVVPSLRRLTRRAERRARRGADKTLRGETLPNETDIPEARRGA